MTKVKLWGSMSAICGGKEELTIDAKNIRELFRELKERYPGIEPYMDRGIAVAIDGTIYRDNWSKSLPEDAEIFLLPRLAGG
jgi:molybdopterin converting factor small subunit